MEEFFVGQEEHEGEKPEAVAERYVNPKDIEVPPGYEVEVFAEGLTTPINIIFDENGAMYVADSGAADGNGKVLKKTEGGFVVVADDFNPPLTGITFYKGDIYVAHRGFITAIKPNGKKVDILSGLPSWGDHHNNKVEFGPDGKMYFGQGTATNSGVVGVDNREWVEKYPFFHDFAGDDINLAGQNFATENFLSEKKGDLAYTGAYSPFGEPNRMFEYKKGTSRASGSILRANPDGSNLELVAWGLRNPFRMRFDTLGRLFSTNHGMDVRGSRPVDNSPDEFQLICEGMWYGWPDFTGGLPVTMKRFKAEGHTQPTFLLTTHPMIPPKPFSVFAPHAAIMGFDFNYEMGFGPFGDAFIAEFGSEAPETTGGKPLPDVGLRVSRIDMRTGNVSPFAINKSRVPASWVGEGGFERPIDVVFGPDGNMYVADFSLNVKGEPDEFPLGSGVIWRVIRV